MAHGLISHIEYESNNGSSYTLFGELITYTDVSRNINIIGEYDTFDYIPINSNTLSLIKIKLLTKDCDNMNALGIFKINCIVNNSISLEFLENPIIKRVFSNNENLNVKLVLDDNGINIKVYGLSQKLKWFAKINVIEL